MSSPATSRWHSLGMEWKEHIAWFAPISITMVVFVFLKYGRDLKNHKQLRVGVLAFVVASLISAGVAGFFGAMLDKYAPVQGGHTIQLSQGDAKGTLQTPPYPAFRMAPARPPYWQLPSAASFWP